MKILIKKDVISQGGWRKEGEIHNLDDKLARHYIKKGIGVEYKEEKVEKETKESKAPKKRVTKKAK
jgi:hypothetical protein